MTWMSMNFTQLHQVMKMKKKIIMFLIVISNYVGIMTNLPKSSRGHGVASQKCGGNTKARFVGRRTTPSPSPHVLSSTPHVSSAAPHVSVPSQHVSSSSTPTTSASTSPLMPPNDVPASAIPSIPSSPATNESIFPDAIEQHHPVIGSTGPNGRLFIGIQDKKLDPSESCARTITTLFKERVDGNGYSWASLCEETINFYWDEFKKACYWDSTIDDSKVKAAWETKARERYSNYLCNIRSKRCKRDASITQDIWDSWTSVWNSEEYKLKSQQNQKNRRGGASERRALSTHHSGSASHEIIAKRLEEQLGQPPSCYEVFVHTHTKNHDKETFTIYRAKQEEMMSRREQLTNTGEHVDDSQLYLNIVGGQDSKKRIYGLGSYRSSYVCSKSSNPTFETYNSTQQPQNSDTAPLQDEIQKLQQKQEEKIILFRHCRTNFMP